MQTKFLKTAILCLLSLASISLAEFVVTTADGIGADAGISNDSNKTADWYGGASDYVEIRNFQESRSKGMLLRFDIGCGVGGDSSGAILSFLQTSSNRARILNIYGLVDETGDLWDESSITYDTAPGFTGPYYYADDPNTADIYFEEGAWEVVGTVDQVQSSVAEMIVSSEELDNFIAADTNGLLTFFVFTSSSDNSQSAWYALKENTNGDLIPTMTFPNASFATEPSPACGDIVLTSHDSLSWTNTPPADAGPITCDVYIGTNEPNLANPDNDYDLTLIAEGTTETSLTIPFALSAGTYYWVVDSYDDGTFLGNGAVWQFEVTSAPQVISDPADQIVKLGVPAAFTVGIESTSALTYTWYMSADNANDTSADDVVVGDNADTLSFAGVAASDEGYYFCKAVNSAGEAMAAISSPARLVVQRQVAHWTMDELSGSVLVDSSAEGNDATPSSEALTFADGVSALITNQGVVFADGIYAQAGTYDPTVISGEFTLSLWLRLDSLDGSTGIICKHNGWASDTTLWQFGTSSAGDLRIIRAGGTNVYGQRLTLGQWYYVAVTFDGSTASIYSYEVGSDDVSFDIGSGAYSLGSMNDADFNIGCANIDSETGDPAESFNGMMDEIQVFNYAKSATEIADLYNQVLAQDFCVLEYGSPEYDLDVNDNCRIDLVDLAGIMQTWLECGLYPNCPQ